MSADRAAAIAAELEASINRFTAVASQLEAVLDGSTTATTPPTARVGRPHKLAIAGCSCKTCSGLVNLPPEPPPTGPLPIVEKRRNGKPCSKRKRNCTCQTCAILSSEQSHSDEFEKRLIRAGIPQLGKEN